MMMHYFPLILACVMLNTVSQICLKQGMNRIGFFEFQWDNIITIGQKILINPYIMGGLFCYCISVGVWLLALSRMEISVAYPLSSLGYITTTLAGYYLFQEPLSFMRLMGIVIIIIGVYFVSRR